MALAVGETYEGKIVNITNFGAFVEVNGEVGLVHISEVSNEYVKDIKEYLKDKENVSVKVISIDEKGKISMSLKQTEIVSYKPSGSFKSNYVKRNNNNFEDILSKYLKDSEERMQDFKKNYDSKQRGSNRRNFL